MTDRRAVYVATGERHLREAGHSIRSLWRHRPDLPVTVYVDDPASAGPMLPHAPSPDHLEVLSHPAATRSWADKPAALALPGPSGERCSSIRTRGCAPTSRMCSTSLERFDLAAAHAPIRLDRRQPGSLAERAPRAFPELNTG
jgi:hypothetical protein